MKKMFIVSACAIALCFTSCATKQAPAAESQTEAPQTTETEEESTNPESSEDESVTTDEEILVEEFPEPEAIEEPEIITLEPEDIPEPVIEEAETEEVEKEEPPVIIETPAEVKEVSQEEKPEEADKNETREKTAEDQENNDLSSTDSEGVIDITEDDTDSSEKYSESEKEIIPSRSVTLKKFEYLDVTYPGSGWIFMGLTDNSKDIAYFGRKLGTKDTKFSLQARNAGTKIAHFYKNDPLSGKYIDDYLEIKVLSENGSNKTHIAAPEYKLPVQKKSSPAKKVEEAPAEEIKEENKKEIKAEAATTPKTTSTVESPVSEATVNPVTETPSPSVKEPDSSTLLQEAQVLYNEKEYKTALNKINQFLEFAADKRDEGLYLKGQILEAKSEIRDIKGSIEAYTSLTKNYPASQLWDSANKRIIYLKRFYLEVR